MDESIAREICLSEFSREPAAVSRCGVGSCNYVFLVDYPEARYVLRIAAPGNRGLLKGAVCWTGRLAPLGLPIPRTLRDGSDADPPYLILSYIDGADLGEVHDSLSEAQKRGIAGRLQGIQAGLRSLKTEGRYGYLSSPTDGSAASSWRQVVLAHLERSRERIAANGLFSGGFAESALELAQAYRPHFDGVEPRAFLDDATTKNVLVLDGKLSGIVDLDCLCFGDDLYAIALTRMSLLARGSSPTYADYLVAARGATGEELRALDFYTLAFCVDFMAELGMKFNRDEVPPVPSSELEKFRRLHAAWLARASGR